MLKDAIQNLKLDRRLAHRRGWIESEERDSLVEALPDVEANATTGEDADDEAERGAPPTS